MFERGPCRCGYFPDRECSALLRQWLTPAENCCEQHNDLQKRSHPPRSGAASARMFGKTRENQIVLNLSRSKPRGLPVRSRRTRVPERILRIERLFPLSTPSLGG